MSTGVAMGAVPKSTCIRPVVTVSRRWESFGGDDTVGGGNREGVGATIDVVPGSTSVRLVVTVSRLWGSLHFPSTTCLQSTHTSSPSFLIQSCSSFPRGVFLPPPRRKDLLLTMINPLRRRVSITFILLGDDKKPAPPPDPTTEAMTKSASFP